MRQHPMALFANQEFFRNKSEEYFENHTSFYRLYAICNHALIAQALCSAECGADTALKILDNSMKNILKPYRKKCKYVDIGDVTQKIHNDIICAL